MDTNRIYDKLESIETKLDGYSERLVRVETKQQSVSGQIRLIIALVLGAISSAITAFFRG
jgi:hypothetical protein